jgi:hypothetical protein
MLELDPLSERITSVGVRACWLTTTWRTDLTKLLPHVNPIRCEGHNFGHALRRNAMPSLKQLQLGNCVV